MQIIKSDIEVNIEMGPLNYKFKHILGDSGSIDLFMNAFYDEMYEISDTFQVISTAVLYFYPPEIHMLITYTV